MAKSCNFIIGCVIASRTGYVCIPSDCGTGCRLSLVIYLIVAKSCDLNISAVSTLCTILVCTPTDFSTGSCLCCYCRNIVTGSRNGFLCNGGCIHAGFILEYTVTSVTGVVSVIAGCCTGCRHSVDHSHTVTKSSKSLLLNGSFVCTGFILEYLVASCTSVVFIVTGCSTGRRICLGLDHIVAECFGRLLCCKDLIANRALHSCGNTGCGTGCRHCGNSLLGVTLSRDILILSLCICPINNKCCCVFSQACLCAGSICYYSTCYCCFYSINVACVIGAHALCGAVKISIGPLIDCLTVRMAKSGNIFNVIGLFYCPSDVKACSVCCPALYLTGSRCLNSTCYGCCCSLDVACVGFAHALSGANPSIISSVILPIIGCSCKAMTKCIAYSNGLLCAYRITTVALYVVSCGFRTGSRRCYLIRSLIGVAMTQLSILFCKRFGGMYVTAVCTLCIVSCVFCTSCLLGNHVRNHSVTMTLSSNFVRLIGVTAITGVGGETTCSTSRIGYNRCVTMLMCCSCNYDFLGNVFNMDIDYLATKLSIVCNGNALIGDVYATHQNGYLHNKGLIVKLETCIEVVALYNGTCRTFHSSYAVHIVVGNVYVLLCVIQLAIVTNRRLKRICKNFHTLDIGM